MDAQKKKEEKSTQNLSNFPLSCKKFMKPINTKIAASPFRKIKKEPQE